MNDPTKAQQTKIFFDGGARPNPGPIEIATVIGGVADIRRGIGPGGNEEAEWTALLAALDRARAAGLVDVVLIGDALGIIRQAQGRQRGREPWIGRFRDAASGFDRVRLRHVPRKRNLAGLALERLRSSC